MSKAMEKGAGIKGGAAWKLPPRHSAGLRWNRLYLSTVTRTISLDAAVTIRK